MHELGLCSEMVKTLLDYMKQEKLTEIEEVTITVGEATGVVPRYMYDCWPAVVEDTPLAKTVLKVQYVLAMGRCHQCENEYSLVINHEKCPKCGCEDYDMMNGYEFEITTIKAK